MRQQLLYHLWWSGCGVPSAEALNVSFIIFIEKFRSHYLAVKQQLFVPVIKKVFDNVYMKECLEK